MVLKGHSVKVSTTSKSRFEALTSANIKPFIINIDLLPANITGFLQSQTLIINIPSKNLAGYRKLIENVVDSEIKNVLFVSSTSVYENSNTTISESDGCESVQSPLVEIENMIRDCSNIKSTIIRFGGLVGYSRNPGKFFKKGRVVQSAESNVNLIHRDDCIGIISRIIEQEVWGEVFNCCADTHPTKKEFYSHAAKSSGTPIPEFAESGDQSFKIISNQKVKQILNYEFLHPNLININFTDN